MESHKSGLLNDTGMGEEGDDIEAKMKVEAI
jgi:hypothetical protein